MRAADADTFRVALRGLYDLFDQNHDGCVDYTELTSGLTMLCSGSFDRKVAAAFALYDYDGDGAISLEEMTRYLTSVFKIIYRSHEGMEASTGCSAEELGSNRQTRFAKPI